MCVLLTVMCVGLVLLETRGASGRVLLAASSRHIPQTFSDCVVQCVSRCEEPTATTPSCTTSCDKQCQRHLNEGLPHDNTDCTVGQDTLHDSLRMSHPRNHAKSWRTKRRQRSLKLREAALIARSVGLDLGPQDLGLLEDRSGKSSRNSSNSNVKKMAVKPRLMSLSDDDGTVTAVVSWDRLSSSRDSAWYLVTWEPDGGGLKGNLLTNTSSASLSLPPDTLYHVQVTTVRSGVQSDCLEVDTHTHAKGILSNHQHHLYSITITEEVEGAVAAILVFIIIISLFIWRRQTRSTSQKDVEKREKFDHFKLFPPPVTLFEPWTTSTSQNLQHV